MIEMKRLERTIVTCTLCPRLVEHRQAVAIKKRRMFLNCEYWGKPIPPFGDPKAQVFILGLAPAAHGGNRTGRVFTGDRSGTWVYRTLNKFGFASSPESIHRNDGLVLHGAFISAAVRCAPPLNKPSKEEIINCRPFLIKELQLLDNIEIVVTLGKIAFDAYLAACRDMGVTIPVPRPAFGHNVTYTLANGRKLVGSYHPSQQNTQTGRLTRNMFEDVFAGVSRLLNHQG